MQYDQQELNRIIRSLFDLYERRYHEAHGIVVYIFNRRSGKSVEQRKNYATFYNMFQWCLTMGIWSKDYLQVCVPWLKPRFRGPKYLNTQDCRSKYLQYRAYKPLNKCHPMNDTYADLIRNDITCTLQLIEQNQALFGSDYELLMRMSAGGMSPYFLATDETFIKLLNEGQLQGSYLDGVRQVCEQFAADTEFTEMVRRIRNEQLRRISKS